MRSWARAYAPHAFICAFYTIAHGLALLNRGLYWDDWVFWRQDPAVVVEAAKGLGSTWPASINGLFFYSQAGITLDRGLAFLALLLSALAVFGILRRLPGIGVSTAMWAAVVFAVFPVYQSRIALVLVGNSLCLALFLSALWLLVRSSPRPGIASRGAACVLFTASFQTASLLVFFGVVPFVLLAANPADPPLHRALWVRFKSYPEMYLLPFVYWLAKRVWFQPSGLYAKTNLGVAYNSFYGTPADFLDALRAGFVHSFAGSIVDAVSSPVFRILILVSLVVAPLTVVGLRKWQLRSGPADRGLLRSGFALIALAVLPYALVGKPPLNVGWESRHQLLIPIGAALTVVSGLQLHSSSPSRRVWVAVILTAFVSLSCAANVQSYLDFEREWLKEQAMMVAFSSNPQIRQAKSLVFRDGAADLNWGGRGGREFYEYSGMLADALGDQSRLGIEAGELDSLRRMGIGLSRQPYWKLGDYRGEPPQYEVVLDPGSLDLRPTTAVFRLMLLDWTNRTLLRESLRRAINLRLSPYPRNPPGSTL